jgi:hypothetical protein
MPDYYQRTHLVDTIEEPRRCLLLIVLLASLGLSVFMRCLQFVGGGQDGLLSTLWTTV